jgi:hypothetical protein
MRATARNARQLRLSQVCLVDSIVARRPMLETIMYLGIGFLCAAVIGRTIFARVHGRAVRLTKRRPEAATPQSFAEVQADTDLLQQAEITALKVEVEALKARLTAERDGASRARDGGRGSSDHGIGSVRGKYDVSAGSRAAEPSIDVFPRLAGDENDHFASKRTSIGRRASRTFVRLCIAFAIGVGVKVAWQYGGDAKQIVSTRAQSSGRSSSSTTTFPPVQAFAATSPGAEQPPVARDLVDGRPRVDQPAAKEQPAAKPEQVARTVATPQAAEQDAEPKASSSAQEPQTKLRPWPDTRPTTIPGWTLREVTKSTVVLQGPSGVWRVTRGDTVPGVGRVESVVRWGKRWLVATSSGLISTP